MQSNQSSPLHNTSEQNQTLEKNQNSNQTQTQNLEQIQKSEQIQDQSLIDKNQNHLISNVSPNLTTKTPNRIKLARDDTFKQVQYSSDPSITNHSIQKKPTNSRSSSTYSSSHQSISNLPAITSQSLLKRTISHPIHTHPPTPSTSTQLCSNSYLISLSDHPHLIPSDSQLLLELDQHLNHPSFLQHLQHLQPISPSHQPSPGLDIHPINPLNVLMLSLVRALSLKLSQAELDLKNSHLELNALRSLLIDSYSVGPGEIERCLVRSRVSDFPHSTPNLRTLPQPHKPPWQIELHNPLFYNQNTSSNSLISSLHPSSSSTQLDLEDLREAMSDNSYFDPTFASSRPSRSQLNTPAPHHFLASQHISESPLPVRFNSSEIKKAYPTMTKLFHSNSALNGKFRKPAPVPPSLSSSSDHPSQNQLSIDHPTSQSPTPHKRNASIGSNLSTTSSQCHSSALSPRQINNVWAFYGWKWNKRNRANGTISTSIYGQADADERANDECEYLENHDHAATTPTTDKLDCNSLPNPSVTRTYHNLPLHQPSQSIPGPSATPIPQQSNSKRIPTDPNSVTILGGFFDSFTRRKRAESSKSALPKSSLQSSTTTSHPAPTSNEEPSKGSPASINVSSDLVTNRSSSLLLDSSCSVNTQTTSNSSSFSVDDMSTHRQLGLGDDPQPACLTLSLPTLSSTTGSNHPPSNYSPSESVPSSAANSVLPSPHSCLNTDPLRGLDRSPNHPDGSDAPSSSTANCATPSLLTQPNPSSSATSSDLPSINRRPSLGQLKLLPDSFISNSKGLPTLATCSDTIVQTDKAQSTILPTTDLAKFPGSSKKIDSIAENSDGELNANTSSRVSSSSISLSSSVTGPVTSSAQTNDRSSSRLRSQMGNQNISLRSSKSSQITCTSQIKSKPQVILTQPATTKSYLSTATGTIGKALGTHASSNLSNSTDLEPNVTTLPNAAFGRLASVYLGLPDSRTGNEPSRALFSNRSPFSSIFPASQTSQDSSHSALHSDRNHLSSIKPPSPTSPAIESIHHRGIDKLTLTFLPPLSNSTMELSTFTNPQSNPPPFSKLAGDEDPRGIGMINSVSSGTSDDEPIIDRFGFMVDAKYGMKLMQKSRDKKKRLAKERLAAMDEQASVPPRPSTPTGDSAKPEQSADPTVLSTGSSASISAASSALISLPTNGENSQLNSARCDASLESSDLEQAPMLTTALPIKSQVDVEAELTSLREALGLAAPNKPNEDAQPGSNQLSDPPSSNQNGTTEPAAESTTQSIRRLLFQLNEMQNMLEKKQMESWGQFITKRRLKLMKASNLVSLHSVVTSSGDPSVKSTLQGTGAVSPASVGAFLGTTGSGQSTRSNVTTTSLTSRINLNSETSYSQQDSNLKNPAAGHHQNQGSNNSKQVRDLITCHDDNLIGIASMGLSNDNNKKALKDEWKEFKKLVIDGIPIGLRPKIWLECSGASELKEPGYYHDLLNLHRGEEGLCLNQIECDVTRTLPTNVYFGGDGPGVGKLRRVLAAMSWHNPLVGYCQGMNMVAATLLLTIPSEEDAFWILVCIVDKILPSHYYTSHLLTSQADQRVLKELVSIYLPQLADHFDALDVELPAITFGWFLSLFADALPIQTLLRVFDIFFIDGSLLLFRISLALLKINQSTIISHDSPASLYAYMRGPMTLTSHHADKLINVATADFKHVKNKQILGLRDKFVNQLKSELGL